MSAARRSRDVVVTGGSRGVGAAVVTGLTDLGDTVVFSYRDKRGRAERLRDAVAARGGRAVPIRADLTVDQDRQGLVDAAVDIMGGVDVLVLSASGGLERDRPEDYARLLNCEAQVDLVRRMGPRLRRGGRVLFLTSHQAHFARQVEVEPAYARVAVAKKAGEDALTALVPWLAEGDVELVVVSADLLEDSTTTLLFERLDPGTTEARRRQLGSLPTTGEFAATVMTMVDAPVPSGHVELHGGSAWYEEARAGTRRTSDSVLQGSR
jgi:NAD(P)-dependent dehydrogenase (short-subunit alcohol dehydrogenase family)